MKLIIKIIKRIILSVINVGTIERKSTIIL